MKTNVGITRYGTDGTPIVDNFSGTLTAENIVVATQDGDEQQLKYRSFSGQSAIVYGDSGVIKGIPLSANQRVTLLHGMLTALSQLCYSGNTALNLAGFSLTGPRAPWLVMSKTSGSTELGFSDSSTGTPLVTGNAAIIKQMPNGYWSLIVFGNGSVQLGSISSTSIFVVPYSSSVTYDVYSLI